MDSEEAYHISDRTDQGEGYNEGERKPASTGDSVYPQGSKGYEQISKRIQAGQLAYRVTLIVIVDLPDSEKRKMVVKVTSNKANEVHCCGEKDGVCVR